MVKVFSVAVSKSGGHIATPLALSSMLMILYVLLKTRCFLQLAIQLAINWLATHALVINQCISMVCNLILLT